MEIEVNQLADLNQAALSLLEFANEEKIFLFEGEMGAGKTTFIKAICEAIGVADVVSSPTFSIVNEYQGNHNQRIYHFDFYRIEDLREAYDIGYEEYFYSGDICLVEWPERIKELLPQEYVHVSITATTPDTRLITFTKI
ncbi:MAG: tRNA ((37)-N6)-threonylcarbamoyltransferase complex ATPase subunit type 1 TsaE [Pedobacter sp.]|jgi:tRNA threonylcarbamoyladenosine biosynthesis protein TsaE|nr:tRNA ((37)-N6)-threonylcarbamoyltransferase complex ATPase subunit type 1 TsaE [Pedobacter sp.]